MELKLDRYDKNDKRTISNLYVDDKWECYVLEDPVRPVKIKGKTAIPAGRYRIIINMSQRFKKLLCLLLGVPNYEGIRIHSGNDADDTEGCLIPGKGRLEDKVFNSKVAVAALQNKIQDALNRKEEVWITIK